MSEGEQAQDPIPQPAQPSQSPRLLERVRLEIRARHYSLRTEKAYLGWIRRFVLFHGRRHPDVLGVADVTAYLTHLACAGHVSASTQNQAFAALLFLFRDVLGRELSGLADTPRAKRPIRLPLVLAREEVHAILRQLRGTPGLMCSLMYGSGLRLLECCRLRVKDVDFHRTEITVRDGKGRKDRLTVLPARLAPALSRHLERVAAQHHRDLEGAAGFVALPDALARKYPNASREWPWQWVFPARLGRPERRRPTKLMKRVLLYASIAMVAAAIAWTIWDGHTAYVRRKELLAIRAAITPGMGRQEVVRIIKEHAKRSSLQDDAKVPVVFVHEARYLGAWILSVSFNDGKAVAVRIGDYDNVYRPPPGAPANLVWGPEPSS